MEMTLHVYKFTKGQAYHHRKIPERQKEVLEKNGTMGKTIIEYARKNKIDIIVISTKGMTTVEEYFFGSVVKDVFEYAHCPVFTIR